MEAVLRALEKKVGQTAGEEEARNIKGQIGMALTWVAQKGAEESPRWIVPPGTEEEKRKQALEMAKRLVEEAQRRIVAPCCDGVRRAPPEGGGSLGFWRYRAPCGPLSVFPSLPSPAPFLV